MSSVDKILKIENPHFTVRLYSNMVKVDLKGSFKNEIEEAVENKPVLKQTIGKALGLFVPLHIKIKDIDLAEMKENGEVKLKIPKHRDVTIPFESKEDAEKFFDELNKNIKRIEDVEKAKVELEEIRERAKKKQYRKRPRAERRV